MGLGGDQGGDQGGHAGLPVEQLIEQGLERYGIGDVDGALAAWELALQRDPDDVRAGAYVDYVRENYELLQSAPRVGEDEVPYGLGAVVGNDDLSSDDDAYEVEVTRGEIQARVERYIESVDEGWFLDDELPPSGSAFADLGPDPIPPPAERNRRDSSDPANRLSRQLPLPAAPQDSVDLPLGGLDPELRFDSPEGPGITLELEADEPDSAESLYEQGGGHHDDEQTGNFGVGAWAKAAVPGDIDFTDQRSAVPTQELRTPRGFVRPMNTVPQPGTEGADSDEDRLGTRPGRSGGTGRLEPVTVRFTPDALAGMGEFGSPTEGRAGPDDHTRDIPAMRGLSFTSEATGDSGDMPAASDGELGDEDRTIERPSLRIDTASETTMERGGASYTSPAPLDQAFEGEPSGRYPPLVIIEDPVLTTADIEKQRDARDGVEQTGGGGGSFGDELSSPGTVRVRRVAVAPRAASTPSGISTDELSARLDAQLEAGAPAGEARADRTRRRVTELIDRAVAASTTDDHATAIVALDLALREDPESAVAQKLIHRHQPAILDVYQKFLGDLGNRPALAMPMHELAGEKLDIRAAFLLSRIDGTLSFEEILDVSGMQRPEAFRHLSMLLLRGILEVR